jgi:ribonuclease R
MNIKDSILNCMNSDKYKPMTVFELREVFGFKKDELTEFRKILNLMEKEGLIYKNRAERYGVPSKMEMLSGMYQGNIKGFGFVIIPDKKDDVFIPLNASNGAMDGDKVMIKITSTKQEGKRQEGEVVNILERGNTTVIGKYEDSKNFGFVVPNNKRIYQDIFIPKKQTLGAKNGEVVIAKINTYPDGRRNPEGEIIEIIGNSGDKGVDILTIIKEHNLPEEFPNKVESACEAIEDTIPAEEYKKRLDIRDLNIVTIDGEDAKDLDDAVSVQILPNGSYYLGVHIADVSNYVKRNNAIDKEALKRGTSVYLIDRVIPMLPKKLSNGVCSLNPKVDRLTLSCFMEIDKTGKVQNSKIAETIIKTKERMTYTDVTKILRDKDEETIKRYDYLYKDFLLMEELFHVLNKRRMERGAIDFDFEESKITLNELGKPIDVSPYERAIANRIIEEFMLVCNETIAESIFWANIPFVYRIHEEPDEEKLLNFNEFVHNLGYAIKWQTKVHPKELQQVIENVKGKEEETVVSTLLLRSLKQARYSPECVGHFGLAAKYYCHFTSPIRRYPDLIIHRIIKSFIKGEIDDKMLDRLKKDVEYAAEQSSIRERVADEAEREVDDLKKAEYMKDKIGEVYTGIISSVTGFGLFVELPNTVEGLIHISSLGSDYFNFDEKHLTLTGEKTKKRYSLGNKIQIKVSRVDLFTKEIYFEEVEDEVIEIPLSSAENRDTLV